jgi:diguanylate cyclase (GGDEF)-like protein
MNSIRKKILVIDADPAERSLIQANLEQAGHETCISGSVEDALHLHGIQDTDMVMLDTNLPEKNAAQVCSALRRQTSNNLPIILLASQDDLESIEQAFKAGATDFLVRPLDWTLFAQRVKYLLRAHDLRDELIRSNARNSAILDAIPDTLLRLDRQGRVRDVRETAEAGRTDGALYDLAKNLTQDVMERIMDASSHAHSSGRVGSLEIQLNLDQERHFEVRLANIDRHETLCLFRDVTETRQAENRVYRLAYFDNLTGLPNRLSFSERLDEELRRASRINDKLAVLVMDLDGFKTINESMGLGAGDQLLKWVADRLQQGLRSYDMVARSDSLSRGVDLARLGGDEFTVIMPHLKDAENAVNLVQRIHEMMRDPFMLEGRQVVLTTSIGIALYPEDGDNPATLLRHANSAMHHAKSQGRDNYQFYNASLTQNALRRLDLKSNLRLALERNEFFLVYQPQLDLASGRILSLEALIRWRHPEHGLVSPMEFIPVAEECGLIVPIGEWVLRTACTDAARWKAAGHPLRMAVNLSAIQFRSPQLVNRIKDILRQTGFSADLLELEVTEGTLMDHTEATLETLNALRREGMHLSLDDFGTGYSSLSYLKRLPLSNLKVDQSFVRGLPSDEESLAIVRAIVALAKNLGFTVTAEGIETEEQARILNELECETLQGYFIGKPVSADEFSELMDQRWRTKEPGLEARSLTRMKA